MMCFCVSGFCGHSQYGNVVQDDLSQHLTKAAHEAHTLPRHLTVNTILDTWTHQASYPLVTVTRSPSGTSATVYQVNGLSHTCSALRRCELNGP